MTLDSTKITRSLRCGTDSKTKWYPVPISKLVKLIDSWSYKGKPIGFDSDITRNIAYTLQHLEYLEQTLIELSLSAVLRKQTYKTYVITSIGIIECLFVDICLKSNISPKGNFARSVIIIDDNKLLGTRSLLCKKIHAYRKLRNKVHLDATLDNGIVSDYQSFNFQEFCRIRSILHELLTCPELLSSTTNPAILAFLARKLALPG